MNNLYPYSQYLYNSGSSYYYSIPYNQSDWIATFPAFSNITSLPYRRTVNGFTGSEEYCKFNDSSYCTVWSEEFGNGHVSVLGWDFDNSYVVQCNIVNF